MPTLSLPTAARANCLGSFATFRKATRQLLFGSIASTKILAAPSVSCTTLFLLGGETPTCRRAAESKFSGCLTDFVGRHSKCFSGWSFKGGGAGTRHQSLRAGAHKPGGLEAVPAYGHQAASGTRSLRKHPLIQQKHNGDGANSCTEHAKQ